MANNSYYEVLERASSFLESKGKDRHAARYVLLTRLGWNTTDWVLHMREEVPVAVQRQFQQDIEQLEQDYPAQYIVGKASFYGEDFLVTEATLIPRPETEELVELCLNENKRQNIRVLDIGTGSGAIAITLKKLRPDWQVSAVDISAEALEVAKKNAALHNVVIDFRLGNLLEPFANERFDVVLSNPPYIGAKEITEMDQSVLKYEPKQALFAKEEGLALYKEICEHLPNVLDKEGKLFLEIGYRQGLNVTEIVASQFPQKNVQIAKDLSGLDRIVWMK